MRRAVWIPMLGLVLLCMGAAAWFAAALYLPYQGFPAEGVFVEVPRGVSRRTIARRLSEKGIVRSRIAFEALCRARRRRTLQAGEYFFDRPVTAFEVFRALADGRVYVQEVTVPEGLAMFEIADLLERQGLATREAFLEAARDPAPIRDLSPGARSLEGFLFPATYQFPHHVAPQEITGAMVRRFREAWQSLTQELPESDARPIEQIVTLASLVERETGVADERLLVAGVFTNRLRRGRALQCDPTVIYALQLAGRYSGSLSSRDLRFNSPYNTYRYPGLPPGPIANPGAASLRAALAPPAVDYLYFVANAQGGHSFSRTLKEHNRNVALYRRLLAQHARAQNSGKPAGNADDPPHPAPAKRSSALRPR